MIRNFLFVVVLLLSIPVAAHAAPPAYQVLIDKSDRTLILFDKDGAEIKRYNVTLGQKEGPKTRAYDLKTPEGDYLLYPARQSQQWGVFFEITYPNANDIARARALGIKNPGSNVGIHGTDGSFSKGNKQRSGKNWTLGCIAMNNRDMEDMIWHIQFDVPIRIQP